MPVVKQAVKHRTHGGKIAEQFAPVLDRPVRRQEGAATFLSAHDDLKHVFGGWMRQLSHSKIVEDEERDSSD